MRTNLTQTSKLLALLFFLSCFLFLLLGLFLVLCHYLFVESTIPVAPPSRLLHQRSSRTPTSSYSSSVQCQAHHSTAFNMAVDLCPEDTRATARSWQPAGGGSPRISFSRDFSGHESGRERERLDGSLIPGSPATSDFDFCVAGEGCDREPSTADELFSDGKILPMPIQSRSHGGTISQNTNCVVPPRAPLVPPLPPQPPPAARRRRKEIIACGSDVVELEKPPAVPQKPSTSFWKFGRSNSLNCGGSKCGGQGQTANFICSMALLTRSRSTGSSNLSPNTNPQKKQQKQQLRKAASSRASSSQWKVPRTNSNSSSSSSSTASNSSYYYGSFHGAKNGVRINPVLNVPHPCIPKGRGGGGFFGIGRLLCSGKEKSSRKQGSLSSPLRSS